ncbi:MAG: hypothetical protein ACUVTX_10210 [Bacteroidales bacterium]
MSNVTGESLESQIREWAERDPTGGFYHGMIGGKTSPLSEKYLEGSGTKPSDDGVAFFISGIF